MKKLLLMMVFCASFTLVGCGSSDSSEADIETQETEEAIVEDVESEEISEVVEDSAEVVATGSEDSIEVNGQVLSIGMNVTEDVILALGDPIDTMEAPSCHYDGNDTIYTYSDFALYTYLDGEENILYLIEITGAGVATSYQVTVGMGPDEVIALCGEGYESLGVIMEYTYDDVYVDYISDESGVIAMIEIFN